MPYLIKISKNRILKTKKDVKEQYAVTLWKTGELLPLNNPEVLPKQHWGNEVYCGKCGTKNIKILFNGEFGIDLGVDLYAIEVLCNECGYFSLWEKYRDSS